MVTWLMWLLFHRESPDVEGWWRMTFFHFGVGVGLLVGWLVFG